MSGDRSAYELEALALGLAAWSPTKLYFQTTNAKLAEMLKLPFQPPITTRVAINGYEQVKLKAFAHHRTQTQEWEPLQKFVEGQGDVEFFSLVGGAHDLAEDDLFRGIEPAP